MIDKANLSDLKGILEIENSSFTNDRFSGRQFKYLLTKASSVVKVIRSDKKIYAYLILLHRKDSKKIRIYSIAVHPQSRGMGFAGKLLEFTEHYAKIHKFTHIHLEVRSDNKSAISLYEKSKFCKSGIIKGYYQDGTDAIIMSRKTST